MTTDKTNITNRSQKMNFEIVVRQVPWEVSPKQFMEEMKGLFAKTEHGESISIHLNQVTLEK